MQENKVGYTNPWVHQEAKQHHRVHKKEDHRHQGTQIGHQTDDSPCAHKGHLTGLPWGFDHQSADMLMISSYNKNY